nr:plasminogen-like [Pocillopora verrucosa]XP_058964161.1 plasminogen-like [Pocillopora verrucosa]
MVIHDTLPECTNCSEEHAFICEDFPDCYYGVGFGYHGNVNVTRSGRMCQSWKSQCPQRHWRIPKDVVKSKNDSNLCHNPDSSAPDGPWCYTTDPNVRWEYCNISRCPPRDYRLLRDASH